VDGHARRVPLRRDGWSLGRGEEGLQARARPKNATSGKFEDVGHYTQIVWRATTQVGCAIAANKSAEYLVCRYLPAGNVVGIDPLGS